MSSHLELILPDSEKCSIGDMMCAVIASYIDPDVEVRHDLYAAHATLQNENGEYNYECYGTLNGAKHSNLYLLVYDENSPLYTAMGNTSHGPEISDSHEAFEWMHKSCPALMDDLKYLIHTNEGYNLPTISAAAIADICDTMLRASDAAQADIASVIADYYLEPMLNNETPQLDRLSAEVEYIQQADQALGNLYDKSVNYLQAKLNADNAIAPDIILDNGNGPLTQEEYLTQQLGRATGELIGAMYECQTQGLDGNNIEEMTSQAKENATEIVAPYADKMDHPQSYVAELKDNFDNLVSRTAQDLGIQLRPDHDTKNLQPTIMMI